MKNQLLGLLLFLSLTATSTVAAPDKQVWPHDEETIDESPKSVAVISGRGKVLPEEEIVRLYKFEEGVGDLVAADTIENSQFKFEIPVDEGLTIYSLMIDYHAFPFMKHNLYLTPGAKVEIDAADNYMFTWPVKSNVPEQAEYEFFINHSKDLWIERQRANIEFYKKRNKAASQTMDSLSRLIRLRDLELLKTRPVSTVWLGIALDFARTSDHLKIDNEDLKSMYSTLDDSLKNSPEGRALYGHLYPESHIGVGDRFPETDFHDIDGNVHRFSEFEEKWCLVDFWSSGCGPCIQALPELRELKEIYPETLELISLSVDSENIWRKASEELHLTGNNWNEGKENYGMFKRLGTNTKPTFLVVAPDGIIKDLWVGYHTGKLIRGMSSILNADGASDMSNSDSSSSSNGTPKIIESIPIYQIDDKANILEVYDMGKFPAGKEVPFATVIRNFDSERGARITGIDGDSLVSECNASRDSIEPGMLISVDFKLKVPEEKGPFDATMRIHYKDVKNPSIIKLHGNAE